MMFSEKNIEDLIAKSINDGKIQELSKRGLYGLYKYERFFRQVDLGSYGRLDLAAINYNRNEQDSGCLKRLNVAVIEIKKGEINTGTLMQATRYCKGIDHLLQKNKMCANFEIFLIGTSICKSDFCYVPDIFQNVRIYTVDIDLEKGVNFNCESGYCLSDPNLHLREDHAIHIKSYLKEKTIQQFEPINPF